MADGVRRKRIYHRDVKINSKDTSLTFWNDCSVSGAVLRGLLSCFTGHAAKHTGARREADAFLHVSVRPQPPPTSRQSAAGVRKRPRRPTPLAAVTASASPRLPHRVCLTASACCGSSLFLPLNLTETARCSPRPGTRPPSLSGDRVDRGGLAGLFVATRRCVAVPPSAPSALRGPPGCF